MQSNGFEKPSTETNEIITLPKMESRDLVKEIKEALLSSSDATDFAGSVADLTLDELLNDDFLGKLPIVSWIIQGKRVYSSISDRLFLGKMAAFLIQLSKSPSSKESAFGQHMLTDAKSAKRFSETILFLLSKLDATQKAAVVAELCKMLIEGRMEIPQFRRLCHTIDTIFVDDLLEHGRAYKSIGNTTIDDDDEFRTLERYGLAKITMTDSQIWREATKKMEQCYNGQYTEDGKRLHDAVFMVLRKDKN
jgi:hypothetical protein